MGTISTKFTLTDAMSPILRNITSALNLMNSNLRAVQQASGQAFDDSSFRAVQEHIAKANTGLDEMEQTYRDIDRKQQQYNDNLRTGASAAGGLLGKVKGLVAAYAGIQGVQQLVGLSDTMTSSTARLGMVGEAYGETDTEAIKSNIFNAAQRSRGGYTDLMASVAKLGLTAGAQFADTGEITRFSELVNKNLVVGGASSAEQASAVYQLTQAMSSGRLQGDEYRSIIENAPLLAKSIEDYMRNTEGVTGTMKEWAAEGLLTADVIKNAVFVSADEVEARFEAMPYTWSQVMTTMSNNAVVALDPLLDVVGDLANNTDVQHSMQSIVSGIAIAARAAAGTVGFLARNWDAVRSVLIFATSALIAYKAAQLASNIQMGIAAAQTAGLSTTTGVLIGIKATHTGATVAETASQWALNTAMYACPVFLLVGGLGLLAGAALSVASDMSTAAGSVDGLSSEIKDYQKDYKAAMDGIKVSDQTACVEAEKVKSIYGQISTTLDTLAGGGYASSDEIDTVYKSVQSLYDIMPTLETTISNQVKDWEDLRDVLKDATDNFYDLALANAYYNTYSKKLEEAITQKIDLQEQLVGKRQEWSAAPKYTWIKDYVAAFDLSQGQSYDASMYDGISSYEEYTGDTDGNVPTVYAYNWVKKPTAEISTLDAEIANINSTINGINTDIDSYLASMNEWKDRSTAFEDEYGPDITGILTNTEKTAEELTYLRDIAEQETVNRFTTAEVKIDMSGMTNRIDSEAGFDGFIGLLSTGLEEALAVTAERAEV